ncbi:integrase catalytic domain-containing protein [Trichonephila clavipes]|uniref:Integrase catalytic domain-containing protein n=1 Tax=Trichonephila clavipes TaxID=2585209 RepID=A0A8X6SMC5_TRICX|nr:integrase catalytic domain-containing protein [Trichonephila clavipes]
MSTKCFLYALRRFLARRGNCKVIYSDNARTFKAAERELAYFANILKDSEFQNFVADKGIHWKFIVERAPWWGGFYERLVKTIKDPLRKILGRALLTFEELSTILSEVEVIVNHRPLTYVENDPGEPEPLTPAHFLELGYGDSKYPIYFIELIDATTAKEPYKKRKTYRTLLLKQLLETLERTVFAPVKNNILINFRLNAIAFCSDIKQAFLQICLADEHKDAIRFLWSDDEPCVHKRPKLQVYRFNRVNFGVSSSPFLLAATIRHHIKKYKYEFPNTVELLNRNFYVDDLISGGNEFEEALQTSRRAKNIMEAAGMDLRKWITNDAILMEQWKKENFNVHPVHETVSLGANGTKVLGLSWNTNEDYLTRY